MHTVATTHVQKLIENGGRLAALADGVPDTDELEHTPGRRAPVQAVLAKAAADLRHAADEIEAELWSCEGFPQV